MSLFNFCLKDYTSHLYKLENHLKDQIKIQNIIYQTDVVVLLDNTNLIFLKTFLKEEIDSTLKNSDYDKTIFQTVYYKLDKIETSQVTTQI